MDKLELDFKILQYSGTLHLYLRNVAKQQLSFDKQIDLLVERIRLNEGLRRHRVGDTARLEHLKKQVRELKEELRNYDHRNLNPEEFQ